MIKDWSKGIFAHDDGIFEYPNAKIYVPPPAKGAWTNNFAWGQEWLIYEHAYIAVSGGVYYGILKRYTGATWVKEPLKTYLGGSWQSKPLKRWTGTEWKQVDTTGV
jgi:hypothetical protein